MSDISAIFIIIIIAIIIIIIIIINVIISWKRLWIHFIQLTSTRVHGGNHLF